MRKRPHVSKGTNQTWMWLDAVLCTLFTFAVAGVLYLLFVNISFFNAFEKAFRDFEFTDLYYAEAMEDRSIADKIVLVNVQKAERSEIAQAIEHVARQQPKVMALDLIFRDLRDPQTDSVLHAVLQRYPDIVTAYYKENGEVHQNHAYFNSKPEKAGFINLYPKANETVIRETSLLEISGHGDTLYSFAAKIASEYDPDLLPDLLKFNASFPIDYTGNQDNFFTFDFDELDRDEPIPVMEGAIVMFGYLGTPTGSEFDIEDKHFTPLNPEITGKSAPDMHGVVIHANIVNMLVNKSLIFKLSSFWTYFLTAFVCFVAVFSGLKLHSRNLVFYDVLIKVMQLLFSILLIYLSLLLLKAGVLIAVTPMVIMAVLGLELVGVYKNMATYLQKKFL